ncbi:MAG: isochorismate synthase [Aequorivita sp.]
MDFELLIDRIEKHRQKQLPFVMFSLAEKNTVTVFLQNNDSLYDVEDFSENGFVIAPFDYKNKSFFIPEENSEKLNAEVPQINIQLSKVEISRELEERDRYIDLIENTIATIKKKNASKIVMSRSKDFPLTKFGLGTLIKRLFSSYPTAFRYIWYHSKTGFWCGATPEILVEIENHLFKTMALAGTQAYRGNKNLLWGEKERDEQQQVTDSITNSLQRVTSVLKVSNPRTHIAGSLAHLRTDITGTINNGKATLGTIATVLHPTPAVCGTPQKYAREFILSNEDYDREFYTGFLGPISNNGTTATLMVNLRCMKIEDEIARIYVGGGITLGSNPEAEWEETQNKMQTMLQVLQPML